MVNRDSPQGQQSPNFDHPASDGEIASKAKKPSKGRKRRAHRGKESQKGSTKKPARQETAASESVSSEPEKDPKKRAKGGVSNLIPLSKRTPEEQRRITHAGGVASGIARRKKRALSEQLNEILSLPASERDKEVIARKLGINQDDIDSQQAVISVAIIDQARKGNVKAFEAISKTIQTDGTKVDREMLRIRREELRMKQEQHRAEMKQMHEKEKGSGGTRYLGIPVTSISPAFAGAAHAIERKQFSEFVFPGGRGSAKSSFVSEEIIDLIEKNPNANALCLRKVGDTLRGSVYNQVVWALGELGLSEEYTATVSPMEITKKSTGQKIFFRGVDDPHKLKSIKPVVGYIAIVWFEELDQFSGMEEVRNIEQSAIRGGDDAWIFKSFNPPRSAASWANRYVREPKESMLVTRSTYLSVPKEWLGRAWLNEAEHLKETNPRAYENEYLGKETGDGGNVFENVELREITDDEVKEFDRIYNGVDWGWFPDPFDFVRVNYDSARLTLYIFDERRCIKTSNEKTGEMVGEIIGDEIVTCDSAEEKSVGDYRSYGLSARSAVKGPGSVEYSMKWLARLAKIVIDPKRCPDAAKEFMEYEFERDKEGNFVSGYPDHNNHSIDAVRYALNPVWRRRGE